MSSVEERVENEEVTLKDSTLIRQTVYASETAQKRRRAGCETNSLPILFAVCENCICELVVAWGLACPGDTRSAKGQPVLSTSLQNLTFLEAWRALQSKLVTNRLIYWYYMII
jgi:hypothetical protein